MYIIVWNVKEDKSNWVIWILKKFKNNNVKAFILLCKLDWMNRVKKIIFFVSIKNDFYSKFYADYNAKICFFISANTFWFISNENGKNLDLICFLVQNDAEMVRNNCKKVCRKNFSEFK